MNFVEHATPSPSCNGGGATGLASGTILDVNIESTAGRRKTALLAYNMLADRGEDGVLVYSMQRLCFLTLVYASDLALLLGFFDLQLGFFDLLKDLREKLLASLLCLVVCAFVERERQTPLTN